MSVQASVVRCARDAFGAQGRGADGDTGGAEAIASLRSSLHVYHDEAYSRPCQIMVVRKVRVSLQ